jgi:pimeloyl-ACP methyl ester carboxylesterase
LLLFICACRGARLVSQALFIRIGSSGSGGEDGVTEETVRIGDQRIAYLSSSGTGRPVVFVHGNSASARTWRPLVDGPFGQRFRSLALDLPGHGDSAPAIDPAQYSLPGYAQVLTGFASALGAADAVFVGWSLGGHIVLEVAPALPQAAGFVIFGTPPVASAAQMGEAFFPNPAMNVGFSADVTPDDALAFASSFTAPGSSLPLDDFTADILRTDGAARAGLIASIGEGRFADEIAVVTALRQPLAIIHGADEQLVSLPYLRQLSIPALWREQVQVLPGAGHAAHLERTDEFARLLTEFIADLG